MSRLKTVALFVLAAAGQTAAQQPATSAPPGQVARPNQNATQRLLPGTRADLFPTIRGTVASSKNAALPKTVVRLRDVRLGRLVAVRLTDDAGAFTFTIDPGSYVVEVLGPADRVIATSALLNVNAGDAVTVTLRLPAGVASTSGALWGSTPMAATIAAAAATAGVLGSTVVGTEVSPTRVF
jgi:hypothetical protein